jgi:hypothetical protein
MKGKEKEATNKDELAKKGMQWSESAGVQGGSNKQL